MINARHRNDDFRYGCIPEKDEILKRVIFVRVLCVDVVKPPDVTEISAQIVTAKLPIDDGVDNSTRLGLLWPAKLDVHCRNRPVKQLVRRINALLRSRTPYNFTWSSLTVRVFGGWEPQDRTGHIERDGEGVLMLFRTFDQCAVDAGGIQVLCRPGSVVLFHVWVNIYVLGGKRPSNPNERPAHKVIAVVASEAAAHDVASKGVILNLRGMGYRYSSGDRDFKDLEQVQLLPEHEWDKHDRAQREDSMSIARKQLTEGATDQLHDYWHVSRRWVYIT
jgi:hypothetical protein